MAEFTLWPNLPDFTLIVYNWNMDAKWQWEAYCQQVLGNLLLSLFIADPQLKANATDICKCKHNGDNQLSSPTHLAKGSPA